MPGKVFISCGQHTAEEREAASAIERWFRKRGFDPYVAVQAQTLADVNSGIVEELKRSDFYVFIDFRRERLVTSEGLISPFRKYLFRGSLFTNQELAIAFLLQFDNVILLRQEGVELNGLLKYMGANAARFATPERVLPLVEKFVTERHWDPSYSRHLVVGQTNWTVPLTYGDQNRATPGARLQCGHPEPPS